MRESRKLRRAGRVSMEGNNQPPGAPSIQNLTVGPEEDEEKIRNNNKPAPSTRTRSAKARKCAWFSSLSRTRRQCRYGSPSVYIFISLGFLVSGKASKSQALARTLDAIPLSKQESGRWLKKSGLTSETCGVSFARSSFDDVYVSDGNWLI